MTAKKYEQMATTKWKNGAGSLHSIGSEEWGLGHCGTDLELPTL
jgi:hypothetical protein